MKKYKILTILPKSIGGRLTTSSIIDGFRSLAHNVFVYDDLKDDKCAAQKLASEKWDFVLGYDFDAVKFGYKYCVDTKIVNYFSDVISDVHSGIDWQDYYPFLNRENIFTFYWDKVLTDFEIKKGFIKNIFYLPHFVNTDIYKDFGVASEYDVMFAGRLDSDYRLFWFVDIIKSLPDVKFSWFAINRHFDDAMSRVSIEDRKFIRNVYRGFIDNENDMSDAINKTKIVINCNAQGVSSLNYRTIQTMACGKMILNDYREEGIKFFGSNFKYYENKDDLTEKIRYYMNNHADYVETCKKNKEVIKKSFSHKYGAGRIIRTLEGVLL